MINALDLTSRAARALRREWILKRGGILSATFGMTYKCNLRCTTCGVWVRGETDMLVELTTAEILTTAKQLAEIGVPQVILVGSEPLLRRDALDVIDGMRALGLEVDVITNGTLFTERTSERVVNAGVRAITVSIDGVGKRHDEVRGQERAWERAMAGLERLTSVKKRLKSRRPRLALHATISRLNADQLEELSGLQDSLGMDVSFQLASETSLAEVHGSQLDGQVVAGEEFISREGSFLPSEDDVRRIRTFLQRPGIIRKHPTLAILASMSDDDLLLGRFPITGCRVVEGEILIDPYGFVRPCSHLEAYDYGNVRDQSIREIWNGMKRRKMVEKVRADMFPICDKCCQHGQNLSLGQKARMILKLGAG